MIWTLDFWKGVGERALKTFLQSFLGALTVAVAGKATAWDVPWASTAQAALGVAIMATFFSVCTSFGSTDFVSGSTTTVDNTGRDVIESAAADTSTPAIETDASNPAATSTETSTVAADPTPATAAVAEQPSPTFAA